MKKSNKAQGTEFEDRVCGLLASTGFWVHKLAQTEVGQPADIIAVKDGKAYLIDCKYCKDKRFDLSRVEPNQVLAMNYWTSKGNGEGLFVICFEGTDDMFIIPLSYLLGLEKPSLTYDDLYDADIELSFLEWRLEHR